MNEENCFIMFVLGYDEEALFTLDDWNEGTSCEEQPK